MNAEDDLPGRVGELIRIGTIVSVDHASASCVVAIGDIQTHSIPWSEARSGATRSWNPPAVGEQVLLFAPDADIEGAFILGALPSDENPPAGDSARVLIRFRDDAVIAYDPEAHALEALLPAGATARVAADGGITLAGDVRIEGQLTVTEDAQFDSGLHAHGEIQSADDVLAGAIRLKTHKHLGVTPGGGQTGLPL